jgi:hypothetical protein
MEGKLAWNDAILALERQKYKNPLEFSGGIARACQMIGERYLAGDKCPDHM